MDKKILLFVVLAVVVLGVFYLTKSKTDNTKVIEQDNSQKVVDTVVKEDVKEEIEEKSEEEVKEDVKVDDTKDEVDDKVVYALNKELSTLKWEASKIVANKHTGTVSIVEGKLLEENGKFSGGNFTIDMKTITDDDNNQSLVKHLSNDDFFAVDKYPTAKIVLKTINENAGKYMIVADLTILDKTNEIVFEAGIEQMDKGLKITSAFNIDRTRWGISYSSGSIFKQLGDKAIKDEISYKLNLVLDKVK